MRDAEVLWAVATGVAVLDAGSAWLLRHRVHGGRAVSRRWTGNDAFFKINK
jgi:hypothetical protein